VTASFDWLFDAVAWLLMQVHAGLSYIFPPDSGAAWGLSIFLLTVAMRIVIFPLFKKQIQTTRKMAELNPQIQALRKRYKNDKQRMNQEVMKVYQEAGANPLGGCLPLVVQFPLFIGLSYVLRGVSDAKAGESKYGMSAQLVQSAQHAKIFGASISDTFLKAIHGGNTSAIVITLCAVIISSTTTFFSMRTSMARSQTPVMSDNPMMASQKYMVYISPLFGLFGLTLPLGVLIYWVTTNAWTLGQSHYIYKKYPTPKPEEAAAAAKTGTAKSGTAKSGTAKSGTAKSAGGRTGAAKTGAAKTGGTRTRPATGKATGTTSAKRSANGSTGSTKGSSVNGKASGESQGRRKKRAEPQDVEPETVQQVVRQQPVRQSRSKRKR
jgi:YidC/Oxa1 family membrane protein insertase